MNIRVFTHKAIKLLVVFSTSILYEKSFSLLALIKMKQRNFLDAKAELHVSETSAANFPLTSVVYISG